MRFPPASRGIGVPESVAEGKPNKEVTGLPLTNKGVVKSHVSAVLARLDAGDDTQAATDARERGILSLR